MSMALVFSPESFADTVALKTQHLHDTSNLSREIELQRPVAMHFESNARPIGTSV